MRKVALLLAALFCFGGMSACVIPRATPARVVAVAPDSGGVIATTETSRGREGWRIRNDGDIAERFLPDTPLAARQTQACAGSDCYRVQTTGYRVEHSADGGTTYAMAYEVTDEAYDKLTAAEGERPYTLSVVVNATDHGHVVFVSAGRDGVLYRDESGAWHRLGVPSGGEGLYWATPPRLSTDPQVLDRRPFVGLAVFVIVLGVGLIALAVRGLLRTNRPYWIAALAVVAGALSWGAAYFPDVGMFPGAFYGAMVIAGVVTVSLAIIVLVSWRGPARSGVSRQD
jgi:hypothetical protein